MRPPSRDGDRILLELILVRGRIEERVRDCHHFKLLPSLRPFIVDLHDPGLLDVSRRDPLRRLDEVLLEPLRSVSEVVEVGRSEVRERVPRLHLAP